VIPVVVFTAAFTAMEAVSYGTHRWLMHGPAIGWHASHHAPPNCRFERNDLFPIVFSIPAIAALTAAATGLAPTWTRWAGAGVTAYGVAYLAVHEIVIHHRFRAPLTDGRYRRWLRTAHAAHHLDGGEPFGMLLPLVSSDRRQRLARSGSPSADEVLLRRASTRPTRSRL